MHVDQGARASAGQEFAGDRRTLNQDAYEGRALVYAEHHAGITKGFFPFTVSFAVRNVSLSLSKTNQTAAKCGPPFDRTAATFAMRFPK